MNKSYLVQRLNAPYPTGHHTNPFAFGGGLLDGGLSPDAMRLLDPIMSFDYMGSAEFEWGAVPQAFSTIAACAAAGTLMTQIFAIPLDEVAADRRDKSAAPSHEAPIFVLCNADHDEVETRIRAWAAAAYNSDLKESTQLSRALRPYGDYPSRTCGWLELDNGFMFFTSQEMFLDVCNLFGVQVDNRPKV